MKRVVLYLRVSTTDQHLESQLFDLRQLAVQRGYNIIREYSDKISGAKAKRPGLDQMMHDARRGQFDIVLVWAFDHLARSVRHFLDTLDELQHLQIEFISFWENIDTSGPLGRAMIVILGAIAELERNLIKERVRAGMRRAKLDGVRLGRKPLQADRGAIIRDRQSGLSLTEIARAHASLEAASARSSKLPASLATEGSFHQTRKPLNRQHRNPSRELATEQWADG